MKNLILICLLAQITWGCSHLEKAKNEKISVGATQLDLSSSPKGSAKQPRLRPAKVTIRHVDDQVKDGVFIPAHLEYEISEPSRWEE